MLGKLLKYEIKACSLKFLPIFGALIAFGLMLNVLTHITVDSVFVVIVVMALVGLYTALGVITIMTILQRFSSNLLSDEGYLMFTLPVSTEKLLLSKLINSILWMILSILVMVLGAVATLANRDFYLAVQELVIKFSYIFELITAEHIWLAVATLAVLLTQAIYFVLSVYFSLTVSQIPLVIKHRKAATFVTFLVTNIATSVFAGFLFENIMPNMYGMGIGVFAATEYMHTMLIAALTNLAFSAVLFFAASFILKKHLNLE